MFCYSYISWHVHLVIEVLGPDWRGLAGNLFCLPFAFGYMFLPGVAYYIREWRYLQLVLCAPSFILLGTWFFLPVISIFTKSTK
jgi:hypothetical protein